MNFYKNYKKIGRSGIIGGCGLGVAMISLFTPLQTPVQQLHYYVWLQCLFLLQY